MKEDSKVLNPNAKLDEMVLITQVYLNETYKNNSHWIKIDENGKTGWPTIRGLIRALQIETGISTPNGNFGPATEAACPTLKKDLNPSDKTQRLVYILQGAMWCKGFSPGGFTGTFGDGTESGVKKFQTSAGLAGAKVNGIADPMIFKALLNMDAYVLVSSGDSKIREIQMNLNRDYHKWIGLRPTDGRYGRDTNKALIYAIQVEEGIAEPNGTFGPTTQSLLPTISYGSSQKNFVKIAQYALYCNRFDPTGFTGTFGNGTIAAVREFQKFSMLPNTGNVGPMTWASLLVSSGDKNRKGTACDCSSEVTDARAKTLKANGYEIVGRYIAGGEWKKLKSHEAQVIFKNGLRLFPIYQTAGNSAGYFTEARGTIDAREGIQSALEYGFPRGTIIYFAVDFDAVDDEVTSNILPYFRKIKREFNRYNPKGYKIGIYGARNVCTRVGGKNDNGSLLGEGISVSSFVCDMSTGFSGNLGYALPPDWAFDQIKEYSIGSGEGAIAIDNNICSNRDRGVARLDAPVMEPDEDDKPNEPGEIPEFTEEESKKIINFCNNRGLFEGTGSVNKAVVELFNKSTTERIYTTDIEFFNEKKLVYKSLLPNLTVEKEIAVTEQLVGPRTTVNFYANPEGFTTHIFDGVSKGGVAFDVDRKSLTASLTRLRVTDEFFGNIVKYYIDVRPAEVLIILEAPMTIPHPTKENVNTVVYQRLYITIKPNDLMLVPIKIPVYVYASEPATAEPNLEWVKALGYVGIGICMLGIAGSTLPLALKVVNATGFINVLLRSATREYDNTEK